MTRSSQALVEATGRDYEEWFVALDAWGAAGRSAADARAWLRDDHDVSTWWAQKLVVEYEQVRGTRVPGARPDGTVTVGTSRTVPVSVDVAFAAVADDEQRRRWLPDVPLHQRAATPPRSLRFDGPDGTRVVVTLTATGDTRTSVSVEQERLPTDVDAAAVRGSWRAHLDDLRRFLEG